MATILSNSNFYVRWDKTDCDNYTITNLLSYATVDVTISDELSEWEDSFSLGFNEENTVILPADGVYKICATSSADAFNDIYTAQPALTLSNSVVNIGPMAGAGAAFISRIRVVGQGNIYESDPPPLQDNDWSNPPSSYSNVGITVNNWLAANGGGFFEIIAPGQQSATFPWVSVDPLNYQVAFFSQANYELQYVGTTQWNDVSVPTQYLHLPDVDCIVSWAPDLENLDPPREYVISFILDGQNVLTEPVYIGDQAGIDNFFDIVQTWLNENGGGVILDRENLWFIFDNCATPGALTLANVLPSNEQCDYIYELCDTYACISRLVQQWLCNPCPDKCDPNYVEAKEARQRAIELSTLFFHGLMPLITKDRLWYLGNWAVNDERICNVNSITGLYKDIRDFLKSCKFNCCNPCDDCNCTDCCSPESGGGNYSTPINNCGCK